MGANSWLGFTVLVESNCTIAPSARIGGHTKIGANSVIGIQIRNSQSEKRFAVRGVTPAHTNVGENCTIGHLVVIGANVALGGSSLVDSYVTIGDGVSIGFGAQIGEKSTVGHGVNLAENVKIATGVKIGEGSHLESRVVVEKDAKLGKNCKLGAGVVIGRGATVGDNNQFAPGVRVLTGIRVDSNGVYGPGVVLGDPKDPSSVAPQPPKSTPLPSPTPSPISVPPPPIPPPTPEMNPAEIIKDAAMGQSSSLVNSEAQTEQKITAEAAPNHETHGSSTFILPSVIVAVTILVLLVSIAIYNRKKLGLGLRRRGRGSSGNKASQKDLQRETHGGVTPDNIYYNTYKASESDEQQHMRQEVRNKDTPVPRDSFQCQEVICSGTFGTVYRGVLYDETLGKFSAVEIAELKDASTELRDNLWDIVEYLKQLEHPQVMACIGLSDVSTGRAPCVLYEYLSLGTLEDHIAHTAEHSGGLTTKQQLWYAVQLAQGMAYLSSCGIVHGNIRSRACKLGVGSRQSYDMPILKIGNLGPHFPKATDLKYFTTTPTGKQAGRWAAPEVVTQLQYSEGSDVWSYGVVVWELAARGARPYGDMLINDVISGLLNGRRLYRPKGTPPIVYQSMLACWRLNMDTRPQFVDVAGKMARLFALEMGNTARSQAPLRAPKAAVRKSGGSIVNLTEHRPGGKRNSRTFQPFPFERKGSKPMPIKIVEAEEAMSRRGSVSKEDFQDVPKPPTRSHSICGLPQMDPSVISAAAQRAGTLAPPQQTEDDSDGNVTTENTTPEVLQGSTSANRDDLIGRSLGSGGGQISPGTAEEGFAWRSAVQESTIGVGLNEGGSGWVSESSSDEEGGGEMVSVEMDTNDFDSLTGIPNYDSIPHGAVSMDVWSSVEVQF